MSYIDLIIKYLAGDLSKEDAASFERELESDAGLRASYELHAAAFELIRHQLQKRDEEAFKAELLNSMNRQSPREPLHKAGFRFGWLIAASAACLVAVLLIFLPVRPGNQKILSRYFHPERDPVVLALEQDTRGTPEPGIAAYKNGNFEQSMDLLLARFGETGDHERIQLYCLLSSMELDRQQEVLPRIPPGETPPQDLMGQALTWYVALALLKSDRRPEALELIHILAELEGPYQKEAVKLEKVLLK
jgi:hypothetical protein